VLVCPGPEHGPKGAESKRHLNVESLSVEENVKVGVAVCVAPLGPPVILVSGGMKSRRIHRLKSWVVWALIARCRPWCP
jgi:hypothetical protein